MSPDSPLALVPVNSIVPLPCRTMRIVALPRDQKAAKRGHPDRRIDCVRIEPNA
jgi:hypothetical protein